MRRKMPRTEILLSLFLFIGVHIIFPGSVLSSPIAEEESSTDDTTCANITKEAYEKLDTCMRAYVNSESIADERKRHNVTSCPECFIICRNSHAVRECFRNTLMESHQCLSRIKHIRQTLILDLVDFVFDFYCKNDFQNLKDVMSDADTCCDVQKPFCDSKRLLIYFSPTPPNSTETPVVEYTERGICSVQYAIHQVGPNQSHCFLCNPLRVELYLGRQIPGTEMLPYLFLLLGIHIIFPGPVLSSPVSEKESSSTESSTCQNIIRGAETKLRTCTNVYFTPENVNDVIKDYNGTHKPQFFIMCKNSQAMTDCLKNTLDEFHQCVPTIKHIRQSFFLDLLDLMFDFYCKNDLRNLKDLTLEKLKDCVEENPDCNDIRMASFFPRVPVIINTNDTRGVDYSERGFCRELIEVHECTAKELKECSNSAKQIMNDAIDLIKNSTSCAEFYVDSDHEETINTPSTVD